MFAKHGSKIRMAAVLSILPTSLHLLCPAQTKLQTNRLRFGSHFNGEKLVMNDKTNANISAEHLGYSDEKLETLSRVHSRFETGIAPWAAHESESSSFGKTFRKWAGFPKCLPLYICSDHGVSWESRCWPNETGSPYKTYFTWNKKKNDLMNRGHKKKSYHVPHPWVFYRKKYFNELPKHRSGTLIFFPHSNDTTTPVFDIDGFMDAIKSMPEKYHPIVLCLSYADVEKGLHKKLRQYNLPMVTAGAMISQEFVDRFYSLLLRFKYSSSANIGSHTFYSIEAGVPFFLFGPYPEFNVKSMAAVQAAVPDGKLGNYGDDEDIREFSKMKLLLSTPTDEVTVEQYALVSKYLGMDSGVTRWKASLIFWQELALHFDELVMVYAATALRLLLVLPAKIRSCVKR